MALSSKKDKAEQKSAKTVRVEELAEVEYEKIESKELPIVSPRPREIISTASVPKKKRGLAVRKSKKSKAKKISDTKRSASKSKAPAKGVKR